MDEKNNCALDELNHMQSKISSLFQDIINERYQCKINLEESQRQAEKLLKKVNHLNNENEMLKIKIEKLINVFTQCIVFFENANFSCANFLKVRDHLTETLQNTISNVDEETSGSNANGNNKKAGINSKLITNEEKLELDEGQFKENIKKEIQPVDEPHLSTQNFSEDCLNENLPQKCVEDHLNGLAKLKDILLMPQAENSNYNNDLKLLQGLKENCLLQQSVTTPKKVVSSSTVNNSPVFRDLGNRKQDNLYHEDVETGIKNCKASPPKLVNEKFLLNTVDEVSPMKRTASQADSFSPSKEILRGKRNRTKSKLDSPKRSPKCQLKKSNSKEADISLTGIRKFTQTLLNVECFKKTNMELKNDIIRMKKGNLINEEETSAKEIKFLDDEEDDVIMESPCNSQEMLEIYSNNKTISNGEKFCTPTGTDLDETFVSSSIVRKCRLNEKCGHSKEETTPLKPHPREKSPEFDSVPFFYKREAVRKKAERMKLPGQVCLECDKYYNIIFEGDINGEDFKKLLNKCSRHRDKIPLDADNTPPVPTSKEQLIAVPRMESSSGTQQAQTVWSAIIDWNLEEKVQILVVILLIQVVSMVRVFFINRNLIEKCLSKARGCLSALESVTAFLANALPYDQIMILFMRPKKVLMLRVELKGRSNFVIRANEE